MAKKIFNVQLNSGYPSIYENFFVKAENASDVENNFDLDG